MIGRHGVRRVAIAVAICSFLLASQSIVYADPAKGGASGVYFAKVLERLGIVDQMKSKTILEAPRRLLHAGIDRRSGP
jgi:hypothetical protein